MFQTLQRRQERDQLRQQLEDVQTEPPIVATLPASTSVKEAVKPWKILADRLNSDGKRIRDERALLTVQAKQLWANNQ